jgi:hypothetical protein
LVAAAQLVTEAIYLIAQSSLGARLPQSFAGTDDSRLDILQQLF